MTQKELSYVEDAVGHEESIIKILENTIESIDDEELTLFLNEELDIHNNLKENLMNLLEVKTNE